MVENLQFSPYNCYMLFPACAPPSTPQGAYPTIVTKQAGGRAAVVQAFAYTKYLGRLK